MTSPLTKLCLAPKPRVNLTRSHGVFAPNSKRRALVTLAKRGKGNKPKTSDEPQDQTPAERRAAMTRAQPVEIGVIVFFAKEARFTVMASLCDVQGYFINVYAGATAGHKRKCNAVMGKLAPSRRWTSA